MKSLLTLTLILASQVSYAKNRKATSGEVRLLCQGVQQLLRHQASDAAVDLKKCLKTPMVAKPELEGSTITGKIPFRFGNYSTPQACSGTVRGKVVKAVTCPQ